MKYCPKCGKSHEDEAAFCSACGTSLDESKEPKVKSKSVFAILALIFTSVSLFFLVACFISGFFFQDSSCRSFDLFSNVFIFASLPFYVVALIKKIKSKKSFVNSMIALVFSGLTLIFLTANYGDLDTLVSTSASLSYYLSLMAMSAALEIGSIVLCATNINE